MGGRSAGPRPGPAAGVPTGGSSPAGGRQRNSGQGRGGWRRAPVGGLHPGRPPPFGRQHRPGCALPRRLTGHQPGLLLPRGVSGSLEWLVDLRHTCSRPTRQGPSLRPAAGRPRRCEGGCTPWRAPATRRGYLGPHPESPVHRDRVLRGLVRTRHAHRPPARGLHSSVGTDVSVVRPGRPLTGRRSLGRCLDGAAGTCNFLASVGVLPTASRGRRGHPGLGSDPAQPPPPRGIEAVSQLLLQ